MNETKEITVYAEGGKGRKQCSACNKYVAARSSVCACGHEFKKALQTETEVTPAPTAPAVVEVTTRHFVDSAMDVLTPAGRCPVALESADPESVRVWKEAVIQKYHSQGKRLAMSGVRYFVQQFFDQTSSLGLHQYRQVMDLLR